MRGQDFIVKEHADAHLDNIFFKSLRRYDFSVVGRYKAVRKLGPLYEDLHKYNKKFSIPKENKRNLCLEDIIVTIKYLIALVLVQHLTTAEEHCELHLVAFFQKLTGVIKLDSQVVSVGFRPESDFLQRP